MQTIQADYCVVGAGYSGLAAALRLKQTGNSFVVVEARNRVGGRIWSHHLSDGTTFDVGGAWVSDWGLQPHVLNFIQQAEAISHKPIKFFTQYEKGMNVLMHENGRVSFYDATAPLLDGLPSISEEGKLEVAGFIALLGQLSTYVVVDAPWTPVDFPEELVLLAGGAPASTTEADRMTLLEMIDNSFENEEALQLMYTLFSNLLGKPLGEVSLLHMLFMLKTANGDIQALTGSGENQCEHYRLHGGLQQMALRIAEHIKPFLRLNHPVQKISSNHSGVVVESAGLRVEAKRVISTVPVALLDKIIFDPPLPAARTTLQEGYKGGDVWKIWVAYDKPFWREPGYMGQKEGLSGESVTADPNNFLMVTLDGGEDTSAIGLLVGFVGAAKGDIFRQKSREERKAIILEELAQRFGKPAAHPSSKVHFLPLEPQSPVADPYFEWSWGGDPFTRGGFAGIPHAGIYTECGETLRHPYNRIHWAGVDTCTYPYATVSGAIQAGERAATEAILAEAAGPVSA